MNNYTNIDDIRRRFTRPGCERKIALCWDTDLQPMFDGGNRPEFLSISGESTDSVAYKLSDSPALGSASEIVFELSVRTDYCLKVHEVVLITDKLGKLTSTANIIWGLTLDDGQAENVTVNILYC